MRRAVVLSDMLRIFILRDGRPMTRIARDAGVPEPVVTRFMAGRRGLHVRSLDRLAAELGLELRPKR